MIHHYCKLIKVSEIAFGGLINIVLDTTCKSFFPLGYQFPILFWGVWDTKKSPSKTMEDWGGHYNNIRYKSYEKPQEKKQIL